MPSRIPIVPIIAFLLVFGRPAHADVSNQKKHVQDNIDKVKDLVSFLQFTLNTIGNPETTMHQRDIIITQSYLKMFRDSRVQIEDDLDPDRKVVTNKDVQAYLKDVGFFFKKARFTLDIQGIDSVMTDRNVKVYIVKLNRNLNAVTIDNDTINQNLVRYLEINYNPTSDDLKIASYYTTKLSEEDDLANWWHQLTFEWRLYFDTKFKLPDSVGTGEIRKVLDIDSIDISDNPYITSLAPLSKCEKLQYLNVGNTYISDLSPLRYLSKLRNVNVSGTRISDISSLHYSVNLQVLNLSGTSVGDFSVLRDFPLLTDLDLSNVTGFDSLSILNSNKDLQRLNISGTRIMSLDSIKPDNNIRFLDISGTPIENLKPLSTWTNLVEIRLERTVIDNLSPLSHLPLLQVINCESTNINNLDTLKNARSLKKIYCDNSGVTKKIAANFNKLRPDVLLIFESQALEKWWSSLSQEWKQVLLGAAGLTSSNGKESLAKIENIDTLSLAGKKDIYNLDPLTPLRDLAFLDCHETGISELAPIREFQELRYLDISHTMVSDLSQLRGCKKLAYLDIESSQVSDITPIKDLRSIQVLKADDTLVPESQFEEIVLQDPGARIIYRTDSLEAWWNGLNEKWKSIFLKTAGSNDKDIDTWFLHRAAGLKKLTIDSISIDNLKPLSKLVFLNTLILENVPLKDIHTISGMTSLKVFKLSKSPVQNFGPLSACTQLTELDLSNTGFEDLSLIRNLELLRKLNLSGTRIRSLKYLEGMSLLTQLDISNTRTHNLKPLFNLPDLKVLTCYNTPLSNHTISAYKAINPDCQVIYY